MKNRFLKILKKTLLGLGGVIVITLIANEIVYKSQIPEELKNANWSGTWTSVDYMLTSGKVLTIFPDPILEDEFYKTKTLLYYNIWSFWRPGQISIVPMEGEFGRENFDGNSKTLLKNLDGMPFTPNAFKAKILFGSGQIIEYSGIRDKVNQRIYGEYESKFPTDYGSFEISPK